MSDNRDTINRDDDITQARYFHGNKRLAFGNINLEWGEVCRPLASCISDFEIFDSERHEYDHQYMITNHGRVLNLSTGVALCQTLDDRYYKVGLWKRGKIVFQYTHRLTAYGFCPNRLYKKYVHHINCNSNDNRAINLLWVTEAEHYELHRLYKKDIAAYRKMVGQIKKGNKWT